MLPSVLFHMRIWTLTVSTTKSLPTAALVSGGRQPQFEPIKSIPSRARRRIPCPAVEGFLIGPKNGAWTALGVSRYDIGGPTGTNCQSSAEFCCADAVVEVKASPHSNATAIPFLLYMVFIRSSQLSFSFCVGWDGFCFDQTAGCYTGRDADTV